MTDMTEDQIESLILVREHEIADYFNSLDTPAWIFNANYPGVGPALVSGPCIVALKDAKDELLNQCPDAVEWLQGAF